MTEQPSGDMILYTTVEGDTLTLLALRFYGPGTKAEWQRIFDANAGVLKDNPWYLAPGTVLRIPSASFKFVGLMDHGAKSEAGSPHPSEPPAPPDLVKVGALMIEHEARRAMAVHGPMRSGHEGKAVIEEELDELWEEIKRYPKHDPAKWRKEAIHLGAMALRFLVDLDLVFASHPPED